MRAFIAAVVVKLAAGFSASSGGNINSSLAVRGEAHPRLMQEDSGYHYLPHERVLLCICAKCGSTSLYRFVYKQVFGQPWEYTDRPFVQKVTSPRWKGKFEELGPAEVGIVLKDHDVFSLAIKRDPMERLISVWRSKVACDGCGTWGIDVKDRDRMVPELMSLANKTAKDCLSFDDFVETLYTVHKKGRQALLNDHFRPQQYGCFRDFGPNKWRKVAAISEPGAARELAILLGNPKAADFPEVHRSGSPELVVSKKARWFLDSITREDYEVLAGRLSPLET